MKSAPWIPRTQATGTAGKRSKLTAADVVAMRKARVAGATLKSLAARYGVTHVAVHFACTRRTWRHVP